MTTEPPVHGYCDPRFGAVRDVFAEGFARGEEVGAAVAVYLDDELVADLWGGVADQRDGREWRRDTPCLAYSCTKALTAASALQLWERGAYDIDAPVATWWPEFAVAGKERVTAAHLLSHQVGLPAFEEPLTLADSREPASMAARLAGQAPIWNPGTAHGYHAVTYGWLAGEIVRRLGGRTVGEHVAEEIAWPGQLELWLGAPDDVVERAARLVGRPPAQEPAAPAPAGPASDETASDGPTRDPFTKMIIAFRDPESLTYRALHNPDVEAEPGGANNPAFLGAGWPSAGVVTTARGLAGFYRDLLAGRIIRPDTLRAALEPRASGPDRVLFVDTAFGLGFMRPAVGFPVPEAAQDSAFGHTGLGGSVGIADLARGFGMGYVLNDVSDPVSGAMRAYRLVEAVYGSMPSSGG